MKKLIAIYLLVLSMVLQNNVSSAVCGTPSVSYFTTSNKTSSTAKIGWKAVTGSTAYNVKWRVRITGAWSTSVRTTAIS